MRQNIQRADYTPSTRVASDCTATTITGGVLNGISHCWRTGPHSAKAKAAHTGRPVPGTCAKELPGRAHAPTGSGSRRSPGGQRPSSCTTPLGLWWRMRRSHCSLGPGLLSQHRSGLPGYRPEPGRTRRPQTHRQRGPGCIPNLRGTADALVLMLVASSAVLTLLCLDDFLFVCPKMNTDLLLPRAYICEGVLQCTEQGLQGGAPGATLGDSTPGGLDSAGAWEGRRLGLQSGQPHEGLEEKAGCGAETNARTPTDPSPHRLGVVCGEACRGLSSLGWPLGLCPGAALAGAPQTHVKGAREFWVRACGWRCCAALIPCVATPSLSQAGEGGWTLP
nr:PREDICTED: uncharacterized protein LOC103564660 [Equus przewalskii]